MYEQFFANRIQSMGTSIFATMSKLAIEHKAVNLGQGFPDFDGPDWIFDNAFQCMKEGKNQYAPMPGIFSLRNAISEVDEQHYGLQWNPDTEITITAGATEALFSTILAFVDTGDEVIMFEPFYDAHQADVVLAGGIPKYVTLHMPDFHFDLNELESQISPRTKMLILNNPNNPTGKVFSIEELNQIANLATKHNLLVLSDEVYEFITFDGAKHIPIASLPGMKERTITISSTGKTFSLTGWKIGYITAEAKLTEAIRKVHQWATFAVNTPGQHAMAYAFSKLETYLPDFRKDYQHKRDLLYSKLKDTPFKPMMPLGSYFMMVEIPKKAINDVECALSLVKDFAVATIPPSVFYGKSNEGSRMLRLCFAKQDTTIVSGAENLSKYSL